MAMDILQRRTTSTGTRCRVKYFLHRESFAISLLRMWPLSKYNKMKPGMPIFQSWKDFILNTFFPK